MLKLVAGLFGSAVAMAIKAYAKLIEKIKKEAELDAEISEGKIRKREHDKWLDDKLKGD